MDRTAVFNTLERQAGSKSEIARQLGVFPSAVSQWFTQGFFPVKRAIQIEEIYGIPRKELIDPEILDQVIGQ